MKLDHPGCSGPYEAILGGAFALLDPAVRRAHQAPLSARGVFDVEHGDQWWTPILVAAMKLPAAGPRQTVRLELVSAGSELSWARDIGPSRLHTRQRAEGLLLVERSGIGRIAFGLAVRDGALLYRQRTLHVLGIRVPARVSPAVAASVSAVGEGWQVSVEVTWRRRLVCRYAGIIRPL